MGGQGNGAALIFDTSFIQPIANSPILIGKVRYENEAERIAWIDGLIEDWATIIKSNHVPDIQLPYAAAALFEIFKVNSLITKHKGFSEEEEWRAVYISESDGGRLLDQRFHHVIGKQGVEPKLKFKLAPIERVTGTDFSIAKILSKIVLGPTVSSKLATSSFKKMLIGIGKPHMAGKVVGSTIPLRPV